MRFARMLLLLLVPMLCGCTPSQWGKIVPVIQKVLEYTTDAGEILDLIDSQVRPQLEGNEELRRAYDEKMTIARQSLIVAIRGTRGLDHLSQEQVAQAFAEFKKAYLELRKLLELNGLMTPNGFMRASPGQPTIEVPVPLVVQEL